MKTFKELNINVHERDFVKDVLSISLVIHNSWTYSKHGQDWLRFECTYTKQDKVYNHVYISTSGEKLVEAGKQFNANMFPFKTTIIVDDKGFYEFT